MNKLLQLKDRNSLDAFNSLVSDLQEANEEWHRMDRSDEEYRMKMTHFMYVMNFA